MKCQATPCSSPAAYAVTLQSEIFPSDTYLLCVKHTAEVRRGPVWYANGLDEIPATITTVRSLAEATE